MYQCPFSVTQESQLLYEAIKGEVLACKQNKSSDIHSSWHRVFQKSHELESSLSTGGGRSHKRQQDEINILEDQEWAGSRLGPTRNETQSQLSSQTEEGTQRPAEGRVSPSEEDDIIWSCYNFIFTMSRSQSKIIRYAKTNKQTKQIQTK